MLYEPKGILFSVLQMKILLTKKRKEKKNKQTNTQQKRFYTAMLQLYNVFLFGSEYCLLILLHISF